MTNRDVFNYKPITICEGHFHISFAHTLDESLKIYKNVFDYFNYDRGALMVYLQDVLEEHPADNVKALYLKENFNRQNPQYKMYASGSVYHCFDERDTKENYLAQAKLMYALGFDGVKSLDGKPGLRKKIGRRLDDEIYDDYYAYLEEKNLPFVIHVADPPAFWDITQVSEYALKKGWFCDETFPSLDDFRDETEGILRKFPKLRTTLAHFYFLSQDIDACVKLFETYPNVSLDLTPGGEMFANFTKCPNEWREFFKKYADRIYYGTDTYNAFYSDDLEDYGKNYIEHRINLVRQGIETNKPFEDSAYGTITPLDLDSDTLMKIYHDNFVKMYGDVRPVNYELVAECGEEILGKLENGELSYGEAGRDALEIANLKQAIEYFKA